MLKHALRKSVRAIDGWLEDDRIPKVDAPEYSYFWLNRYLFPKIFATEANKKRVRAKYLWGVIQGANLARVLSIKRISVIEFGVATGQGLLALETIVKKLEPVFDVQIDIYGFDTGVGLPKPTDCRDMPYQFVEGHFKMDEAELRRRLTRSTLILGLVEDTVGDFIKSSPPPIAFISFDLDYYTSTVHALRVFECSHSSLLPRIHCYFDDIMGYCCADFNGERLAINEFNQAHESRKLSPIFGLHFHLPPPHNEQSWSEMYYVAHIMNHPLYAEFDGLSRMRDKTLTRNLPLEK